MTMFPNLKPLRMGLTVFSVCIAFGATATSALAGDASPWSRDTRSAIRLIAGSSPPGAQPLRVGIEVELAPGWKTYWRYPGDSGVPPRFDFSGSDNLRNAEILWPAPHVYADESGSVIGYKDKVIFPVEVTARDPAKPVMLRLKADYAVCEKLCVPAEGQMTLALDGAPSPFDAAVAAADAQVPKTVSPQQAGLTARRAGDAAKPSVYVDIAGLDGKTTLLAEGPNPEWALPVPKPAPGAPAGQQRFSFELDGLPSGVDPKGPLDLTFTILRTGSAVATSTHLD
jgi:DsbC/DsbD-like thiol-disulfide interchange protein